jgi:hypothetical protein
VILYKFPSKHKRKEGSEISNWWFSDEDLQEALNNIVDVPPKRKSPPRKLVTVNDNAQKEQT